MRCGADFFCGFWKLITAPHRKFAVFKKQKTSPSVFIAVAVFQLRFMRFLRLILVAVWFFLTPSSYSCFKSTLL